VASVMGVSPDDPDFCFKAESFERPWSLAARGAATRTAQPDRISGREGPRTGSTANGPDRISITSYSLQSV
jgi:hypothetical protein